MASPPRERQPLSLVMMMRSDFLVVLFKLPIGSMSKLQVIDMRDTTRCMGNARQLKLSKQVLFLGASTLTRVSGKNCGFLVGTVMRMVMTPPAISMLRKGGKE